MYLITKREKCEHCIDGREKNITLHSPLCALWRAWLHGHASPASRRA